MREFPSVAAGLPVVTFEEIGSTNVEALARAARLEPEQWIVAGKQTAGRGRRGRPWVSEPGNLFASALLYDPAPSAAIPQICFVAALALHDAVIDVAPNISAERLRLKWPNDLLLDGKKVAGILVEGTSSARGLATVVGCGVNCSQHPADTPYPTTDLNASGISVSAHDLFARLAVRFMDRLAIWRRGANFSAIRNAWLLRAHGVGSEIEVRLPERAIRGRFEAIDDDGALVVGFADGKRELVRAGDVFPVGPTG